MSSPRSEPRKEAIYYRRARFTTHLPRDRKYSPAHYWLLEESSGIWRVGLTKFATRMLGDIVEFEFSVAPGTNIAFGDAIGTIEGLKAVSSVFAAGSGRFLGEGAPLRADVTRAEFDPYGEGWLIDVEPKDVAWQTGLVTGAAVRPAFDAWLASESYKSRIEGDSG